MTFIRKASLNDIGQLSRLFDAYRVFYKKDADVAGAKKFLSERIQNNESEIFVAEIDNSLVGFVQLYPLFSSTRMKRLWLLNDLFVDAKHRGKNISVFLMEKAKEFAIQTNSCGLILETAKTNDIGNSLYPRTGFALDNDHNYYSWDV
jgi:GNAT superfamily N-acetyltransferase